MKKAFYLFAAICFSSAHAGTYDDFFVALIRDDPGTVKSLIAQGFDANSVDPQGQPAANVAIQRDSARAFAALVETPGLDVNQLNKAGESALMLAAIKGQLDWCEKLLQRGARVNQPGWSPLHYAATGPNPRIVELLLARGAEVEAVSPNGSTPLMMAARYGSEESVRLLLAKGADTSRRNERDLSAADFARLAGRAQLADTLQRAVR
ncbi:MAG: ankyrin repeat domain-containing protein [Piscinibacter sp.]|uniref:ankyrin repeat domain-containing protein n=1 Tax=Piscinibacter sp. TaxID=1903157 RepID=UPI00258E5D96|nr:ankyrin repeat domain-containing protein [Piscinibacter sp.]MCW5664053.1 ankyrin repeat domain-containing protein [Piscinibacter sp.]